jgi:TRAP-type mannitol/chloroaromatic compound transport system permease small subunit
MNILKKYIETVDSLNERIGKGIAWLTLILVLVVCFDVISRYVFKSSSVGVQELEWHIFAVIFLMGAAYTLKHDKHVRVDIIFSRLTEKKQAVVNIIGTVLFLIPFSVLIIFSSFDFVWNSFTIGESSPDPGGLPARFILKAVLPLSFIFILFQGTALLFKSILILKNNPVRKT